MVNAIVFRCIDLVSVPSQSNAGVDLVLKMPPAHSRKMPPAHGRAMAVLMISSPHKESARRRLRPDGVGEHKLGCWSGEKLIFKNLRQTKRKVEAAQGRRKLRANATKANNGLLCALSSCWGRQCGHHAGGVSDVAPGPGAARADGPHRQLPPWGIRFGRDPGLGDIAVGRGRTHGAHGRYRRRAGSARCLDADGFRCRVHSQRP